MALVTRYVHTDSAGDGDGTTNALSGANCAYAKIAAWNAAEACDLVTAGDSHLLIVDGTGAKVDQDEVIIAPPWVTGYGNGIEIINAAGSRHAGAWNASGYIREVGDYDHGIRVQVGYVTIDAIQIKPGVNNKGYHGVVLENAWCIVRNCIIRDMTYSSSYWAIRQEATNNNNLIHNNLVFGCYNGIMMRQGAGRIVANNTIIDCLGVALHSYYGDASDIWKNNLAQGTGGGNNWTLTGTAPVTAANITEDATSPDAAFRELAVLFANEGGDDYHLHANDTAALGAGVDMSAYFATDIDGDAIALNSIGADDGPAGTSYELSGTITAASGLAAAAAQAAGLSASAAGQSAAAAAVKLAADLVSSVTGQSTAAAAASIAAGLAGASAAAATAAAVTAMHATITGAIDAAAGVNGNITGIIRLGGSVAAASGASAAAVLAVSLAGAIATGADVTAVTRQAAQLAASTAGVSSASGSLSSSAVTYNLAAAVFVLLHRGAF